MSETFCEWAIVVMCAIRLVLELALHGVPKAGLNARYNIWVELGNVAILVALLYGGGFWD